MIFENPKWTKRCQEAELRRRQGDPSSQVRTGGLLTAILICLLLPLYLLAGIAKGVAGTSFFYWLSDEDRRF